MALKVWSYIQDCDSPVVHQMMGVLDFLQERKDFHWKASLTQLVVHLVVHLFLAYLEEDPNGDFALPDLNCFPCQVARLGLVTDPAGLVHGNHLEAVPVVVHGQEATIDIFYDCNCVSFTKLIIKKSVSFSCTMIFLYKI